jgi:hypothetical protein
MCLLIAEVMFLVMGIYAILKAELPSWFVGNGYIARGAQVRVLGVLLAIPLPLSFFSGIALALIDEELIWIGSSIELISMLIVSLVAVLSLRRIRVPVQTLQVSETNDRRNDA